MVAIVDMLTFAYSLCSFMFMVCIAKINVNSPSWYFTHYKRIIPTRAFAKFPVCFITQTLKSYQRLCLSTTHIHVSAIFYHQV
jgi:hypothetical protein